MVTAQRQLPIRHPVVTALEPNAIALGHVSRPPMRTNGRAAGPTVEKSSARTYGASWPMSAGAAGPRFRPFRASIIFR